MGRDTFHVEHIHIQGLKEGNQWPHRVIREMLMVDRIEKHLVREIDQIVHFEDEDSVSSE